LKEDAYTLGNTRNSILYIERRIQLAQKGHTGIIAYMHHEDEDPRIDFIKSKAVLGGSKKVDLLSTRSVFRNVNNLVTGGPGTLVSCFIYDRLIYIIGFVTDGVIFKNITQDVIENSQVHDQFLEMSVKTQKPLVFGNFILGENRMLNIININSYKDDK
jgi:hypothetical protein